jgi:uncharacterized membrane protein YcaP (DUF421 family)
MAGLEWPNLGQMLVPDQSLFESFLRGVAVYFTLLMLFRVSLNRQAGGVGLTDVMLVVLVSECVSAALGGKAVSIPNGIAAVCGLLVSSFLVDWASYRSKWVHRLVSAQPLQVVRDGRPIRENLARERMTDDELLSKLREQGIDDVAKVRAAFVESEGQVSVIPAANGSHPPPPPPAPAGPPPEFETVVRLFAEAAERLQAAVAWHEDRAAEHLAAVREAKAALARHGIRGPGPSPRSRQNARSNGRHDAAEAAS